MHLLKNPVWLVLALVACGPPAWQAAKQAGTARAYEQFALEYTRYPQAETAMNRAEALRWQTANEKNTAAAWSAYLRRHSESKRADEARKNLDDRAYDEALNDKDALALERYIAMFPNGAHRKEARGHLDAVRWHDAKQDDTHVGYRRYLLTEPKGVHVDEATDRYQERVWERAVKNDTHRALNGYLAEFPEGPHAQEARERLAKLSFDEVIVVVALGPSWQTDRRAALAGLAKEVTLWTHDRLKRGGFKVIGSTQTVDIGPDGTGDPMGTVGLVPGQGAVVVVVSDKQGEAFEPSGHATEMTAELRVHVGARPEPLTTWTAVGVTSDKVRAANLFGLYTDAGSELMADAVGPLGRLREFHPSPP